MTSPLPRRQFTVTSHMALAQGQSKIQTLEGTGECSHYTRSQGTGNKSVIVRVGEEGEVEGC